MTLLSNDGTVTQWQSNIYLWCRYMILSLNKYIIIWFLKCLVLFNDASNIWWCCVLILHFKKTKELKHYDALSLKIIIKLSIELVYINLNDKNEYMSNKEVYYFYNLITFYCKFYPFKNYSKILYINLFYLINIHMIKINISQIVLY